MTESYLLLLLPFLAAIIIMAPVSQARFNSIGVHPPQLPPLSSAVNSTADNHNHHKKNGTCSYTVDIWTSCVPSLPIILNSGEVSLRFGDAYGNQVYAARLDDPYSRTFQYCAIDRFKIKGPCTYKICYAYFYKSGYDIWMPDEITIRGFNTTPVRFYYYRFIPAGVWFGRNHCSRAVRGYSKWGWSVVAAFGTALYVLLGSG